MFQSPKNSHNPLLPPRCGPKDISRIAIIARSSTWRGNETEDAHLAVSESSRINNELIPRTLLIVIPNLVATTAGIGTWKAPSPAFSDPDNNSFHRTRVSIVLFGEGRLTFNGFPAPSRTHFVNSGNRCRTRSCISPRFLWYLDRDNGAARMYQLYGRINASVF